MERQIKLSVRISRELSFINVEEIESFLTEHQWIRQKYEGVQRFNLDEIYDDLLDYLESKKERYTTLKQIINQDKRQINSEMDQFVSIEFKEYNFLKKLDELRATLANHKEKLQSHLQFILYSLDRILENQSSLPVSVDVDRFKLSNSDEVIVILEFFGYKLSSIQNKGFTTLECQTADINFTQNSIVHMSDNLKEELYYDEIQILKEQDRQKEIEKKLQSINAHRHKANLYDFQRKKDGEDGKSQKNQIKDRVMEQMKAQIYKSQNVFLQRPGYVYNQEYINSMNNNNNNNNNMNNYQNQNQQKNTNNNNNQNMQKNINIFEEFERLAEKDVFKHVNQYRESSNFNQLKWNDTISNIARGHSIDMGQQKSSFGHDNFQERRDMIEKQYKSKLTFSCENIFQYYTYLGIAKNALEVWKSSVGNDSNILARANQCGIGAYRNPGGIWYITMIICQIED